MAIQTRIEVREEGGRKVLHWPRGRLVLGAGIDRQIQGLAPALYEFDCSYGPQGLTVLALTGAGAEPAPDAEEQARKRLEHAFASNRWAEVLESLASRQLTSPGELFRRARSYAGVGRFRESARDLEALMALNLPGEVGQISTVLYSFPAGEREAFYPRFVAWFERHAAADLSRSAFGDLPDHALGNWSDQLLLRECEVQSHLKIRGRLSSVLDEVARRGLDREAAHTGLLSRLLGRGPDRRIALGRAALAQLDEDTRLAEASARRRKAEASAQEAEARRRELDHQARVELIERHLALKLPRAIAAAWDAGESIGGVKMTIRERPLREVLLEAGRLSREHFPGDGEPAFLPLGEENGETVGLYLALPRSGDYAVVKVAPGKPPAVVASSTVEWMEAV